MKQRFLLLKTGDTLERVKAEVGDFDRMFATNFAEEDLRLVQAHRGEALPALGSFDALIITGSPASVTAREPWAEDAAKFLRDVVDANKPVLGVCYGHQLLAHAIGGEVVKNANGYEVGTIALELSADGKQDPLLRELPAYEFHSTHSDAVAKLPAHARVLASTPQTAVQAFVVGDRAWGVQFHPEFNDQVMRLYVEGRVSLIASEAEKRGLDPKAQVEKVRSSVRATPSGPMLLRRFAAIATSLFAACSPCLSDPTGSTEMRLEDTATRLPDFAAHPFPSNARKRPTGQLDLSALPNPNDSSTLKDYAKIIADETYAFSTVAAMYMSFTAPLDVASLPADPLAATREDSSLSLVDIDPASPERGARHPINLRFQEQATLFLPPNTLTVVPPYGIPLAPDRTYALIGRTGMRSGDGSPLKAGPNLSRALHKSCVEDAPAKIGQMFEPLRRFFEDTTEDADDAADEVVAATVFTTQGVVREIRQIAEVARALPVVELTELAHYQTRTEVNFIEGVVHLPSFQEGEVPFSSLGDGGGIKRNMDGVPLVDHFERTRVSFSIPRKSMGHFPGERGWPVVLYSHGTGGDYTNAFDAQVAEVLGSKGIAVVGYDQTLHGPRDPSGSNPDITFFNLFNPIAARDNVRQGTADLVTMTNLLASGRVLLPAELAEEDIVFDPERIAFLGHSQGALVAAPFLTADERIKAVVFSGLGAILTITLLERKDIVDFKGLLESLLKLPADQPLDEWHPVMNLIQTFIEPADPISYARSYLSDPPAGTSRRDILQVEGFLDFASPARGQEAFATAARIPLVSPQHRVPPAAELVGPAPIDAPAEDNITSPSGPLTYGLIQYPEETHFPIFENADANARYVEFLRSVMFHGGGVIIPQTRE